MVLPSSVPVEVFATAELPHSETPVKVSSVSISESPISSAEGLQHLQVSRSWRQRIANKTLEQRLLLKLDFYIMSWACFGYFLRLLDTSNMSMSSCTI